MKKYTVEFIGTFFLVLTIGMASGSWAPLVIGSALTGMIYAGGHISGAHYNPAVTLGFWMRGKMAASDIPGYVIAQVLGAVVAALFAALLGGGGSGDGLAIAPVPALLAEFLGTFALVYVILHVATAKGTSGNSFYGLAIGFTVFALAAIFGGISGGVFNPAVAIGASTMQLLDWGNIWIYLVANFGAGALGAVVFLYVNGRD